MANNRLFLVDTVSGDALMLAKGFAEGWQADAVALSRLQAFLVSHDGQSAYGSNLSTLRLMTEDDPENPLTKQQGWHDGSWSQWCPPVSEDSDLPETSAPALTMKDAVIDIVFDGPPSHESGRFVEVERGGKGIKIGEWVKRDDGFWALRIPDPEAWMGIVFDITDAQLQALGDAPNASETIIPIGEAMAVIAGLPAGEIIVTARRASRPLAGEIIRDLREALRDVISAEQHDGQTCSGLPKCSLCKARVLLDEGFEPQITLPAQGEKPLPNPRIAELEVALRSMIEHCKHADHRNGVTDPTGSQDQGDHYAWAAITEAERVLGDKPKPVVTPMDLLASPVEIPTK